MKKFTIFLAAAMMILSLAACTPTTVKQSEPATVPPGVEMTTGGAEDKVPDPNVAPMDIVSVYSINEDATGLNQAMDAVEKLDAQPLVDKLIEYGVLDEGTTVNKFEIKDGIGTLDLSKAPAFDSGSAEKEKWMLAAIGNTFIENYNNESGKTDQLKQLKLLVEGKNYSGANVTQGDGDYLQLN